MTTRYEKEKKRYEEEEKKKNKPAEWDRESIVILALVSSAILLSVIATNIDFIGYYVRNNLNWSTTCGEVISITPHDNMEQTRGGNRYVTEGYFVEYNYIVDSTLHQSSIYLSSRAIRNKLFVHKIKKDGSIKVYYKKNDHKESHIDINVESAWE